MLARRDLLNLPPEVRQQIIVETLVASNDKKTTSKNYPIVAFDRPVLSVYIDLQSSKGSMLSQSRSGILGFSNAITNLLNANRQIRDDTISVICSHFALHLVDRQHTKPITEDLKQNDCLLHVMIDSVRHLHMSVTEVVEWTKKGRQRGRAAADEKKLQGILDSVKSFPNLVSVRLQICVVETLGIPGAELIDLSVARLAMIVRAVQELGVKCSIYSEPDPHTPWGDDIIGRCQGEIGQTRRTFVGDVQYGGGARKDRPDSKLVWSYFGYLARLQEEEWERYADTIVEGAVVFESPSPMKINTKLNEGHVE